jgi:hypothetical protein
LLSRLSLNTGVHIKYTNTFNANRVLVEKPEGKRPLGRPRRRWEDNMKVDLQEMG